MDWECIFGRWDIELSAESSVDIPLLKLLKLQEWNIKRRYMYLGDVGLRP